MVRKLLIAALSPVLLAAATPSVRVDTPQGPVIGQGDGTVETFKGLPYAAPPVGPLRWRAPEAAPVWTAPRDASAFGPVCVQRAPASSVDLASRPQSEDCLTLNLWRPSKAAKAPVMVWIHGGANIFGAGSESYYDGTAFAKRGIVLVTINYRLGHLGFFGHPALKAGGGDLVNYGLMDQVAALRWVKANIASFGGDPARVTIFGESAGGGAVLNLLGAPGAQRLFSQAIVESGGGLILRKDVAAADKAGTAIAAALGLKGDAATPEALRALPAGRFIGPGLPPAEPGFGAVVGGAELREPPLVAIRAGRSAKVPLMIGVNSNEGSLVDSYGASDAATLALLGGETPDIANAYGKLPNDPHAYVRKLYGDVVFAYPARSIARSRSKGPSTFLYYFDYVAENLRSQRSSVNHAGEIPFVFDMSSKAVLAARTERDSAYAKGVNSCFAAFAISGKPSDAPFCATWSAYDGKTDNWFAFREPPAPAPRLAKQQLDAIGGLLTRLGLD